MKVTGAYFSPTGGTKRALEALCGLFSGEADFEHMPATKIDPAKLDDGKIGLLDLLVATGLTQSKGEGRRLVEQGGITLDGEKVEDALTTVSAQQLQKGIVLKKGKKIYHKATM